MKHLIIIDMQRDFLNGALANPDAVAIVPRIKVEIEKAVANGDNIIFTQDTHSENYLSTNEGKHLPVVHCVADTDGWDIEPELLKATGDYEDVLFIEKRHFGYDNWKEYIAEGDDVTMCGTCTDICVVSNALAIKAIEGVEVNVIADCCAGLSKEKHEHALDVMASCQCNII